MAAIKNMARHPKYSPTIPLNTLEAKMPVNNPDMIIPTFRPLFLGVEYWAAIGTNI